MSLSNKMQDELNCPQCGSELEEYHDSTTGITFCSLECPECEKEWGYGDYECPPLGDRIIYSIPSKTTAYQKAVEDFKRRKANV